MRTTSFLVAALVAASSVAAQQETNRIYYPRHIKRQFTNVTITSVDSAEPSPDDSTKPDSQSTKRQDVQGNLGSNLEPPDVKVTTVVVQSTVFVPPNLPTGSPAGGSGPPDKIPDDTLDSSPTEPTSPTATETDTPETRPTGKPTDEDLTGGPTFTTPDNATTTPDAIISEQTTSETTSKGITIGPIGIITETTTTDEPETTPTPTPTTSTEESTTEESKTEEPKTSPTTTDEPTITPTSTKKGPLDPITSALSEVVSAITSLVGPPLQNGTETETETKTPDITLPTLTLPTITIPDLSITPTITLPTDTSPSLTLPTETPPTETPTLTDKPTDPPITDPTISPTVSPTVITDPPPVTNTTEPPITSPTDHPTVTPTITEPPPSSTLTLGPSANVTVTNTTVPTATDDTGLVTSIPHLGTVTNTQSWLPTTIILDPTSTTAAGGLAPTTATGVATSLPKAITPETNNTGPVPDDLQLIQIGFEAGYNYEFVVANYKAAAQMFNLLPRALSYAGGVPIEKTQVRKLVPLDTVASLGYTTSVLIATFPKNLVEALKIDIKLPTSALYNNPEMLIYNFTKQINPSIELLPGLDPESGVPGPGSTATPAPGSPGSGTDPFNNENPSGKSSTQQGATAGIVGGAVIIAAAYGAAMFIIARRYKRKKLSHRRASSITNSSDMQHTPRSSPALMGGALLSRDFTSYGGVAGGAAAGGMAGGVAGGVAGGRNSHGSGRSGMGNSARTQYISAPVAAENSLGWN